ncbi:MAG: T9SS type A sorting domain-containing protein, partial [Bacteroidales bacterium]|nr:T9SS type A sorting domain-containing protein [Bacteroidales bacterium]
DLNRNFPDPEDGPHPDGNPWQTETIHFMDFAEERNLVMGANIHGGAEVCNYPWDTWATLAADNNWWVYVCREYADTVHANAPGGYMTQFNNGITNGYQWYTIAGGRQDYMNYFHQMREFTLEISDVKLLPAGQLPAHWNYNYKSLLNYLEQCLFGVRGKITDSATGEAIKAEAYVLSHESDSSWVYSSLPEGNYHRLLFESIYSIRYSKPGYYTQTYDNVVVNEREATVLDVELVNAFSGVNELKAETFRIYPNPVTGNYIKLKAEQPIEELSIYSMNGELCYKTDANGANSVFVDVSMLDAGTYIISIELGDRSLQQKMIRH